MGNFCSSCSSKTLENQPLNLSQKFSNNNEIKSSSGFSNNIFKESLIGEKRTMNITISESVCVLLTRLCRGYLLRKRFNSSYQTILLEFQKELFCLFEKKHTSYLPSNIWEYKPEQWADSSVENFINKDNNNKLYADRILFEYDESTSNASGRFDKTITELVEMALSGYKGTLDRYNQKEGFGTLIYNTGKVMRGFWVKNDFTGWNEIIEPNGNIMIGEFEEEILNGKGEQFNFVNKQDLYYKGDYVQGRREGQGVEIIKSCIFEGTFMNNMKIKGKATYESGDIYEGSFDNNVFHGEGHYIWKRNCHEYIGGYSNGKYDGHGIYKWSEVEYYKGEYQNGIKEGHGEMHMKNGIVFIGPFVNGVMHGEGDYKSKSYTGKVEFINGQLNKNYVPKKKNVFKNLYKKKEKERLEAKESVNDKDKNKEKEIEIVKDNAK